MPILEIQEADSINEGDILEIDLKGGVIKNHTQNCDYAFNAIPPFMLELLESGGLIPYAKNKLGETNAKL